ncbi:MAG: hypothetical protein K2X27_07105, partial [Candidatus Obscuribacterales bacterium]|nr:hypothetical protein [Candidatus Obscuribacterales bacterium]
MLKVLKVILPALLIATLGLSACQTAPKPEPIQTASNSTAGSDSSNKEEESEAAPGLETVTLAFAGPDGKDAFKVIHSKAGGSIINGEGQLQFTFSEAKHKGKKTVSIQDALGKEQGFIKVSKSDAIKVEDADHKMLYKLKTDEETQHFKLKDADGKLIYKFRKEEYGMKISAGEDDQEVATVRIKDKNAILAESDGSVLLKTKSELPAEVLACFSMKKIKASYQYALAYALMFMR